MNKQSEF